MVFAESNGIYYAFREEFIRYGWMEEMAAKGEHPRKCSFSTVEKVLGHEPGTFVFVNCYQIGTAFSSERKHVSDRNILWED